MRFLGILTALLWVGVARADITGCACDPAKPETLELRECGLTREALKQPPELSIFFLKDASPRKPNRWLVLPRAVKPECYRLAEMGHKERTELWTAAIRKAKELWQDDWGLAYNGDLVRTQCHVHIHVGRLLKGVERDNYIIVTSPAEIPVPKGDGLWVHPHGNRLHVHRGEQINETVLLR